MRHDYDIAIIGAGMTGASLACALAPSRRCIAVIEPTLPDNDRRTTYDDRGITLSPSSRRVLEHIGVWRQLSAHITPITQIHISERGHFGMVRLKASDLGRPELAYVAIAKKLGQALHQRLNSINNIMLLCPAELNRFQYIDRGVSLDIRVENDNRTITAGLLVACDGSHSRVRHLAGIDVKENDFRQVAMVAGITTQKANNGVAYERFTPHGPIALLPVGANKSVLVFTVESDEAERYMAKSDAQFIRDIECEFGRRLGGIEYIGARRSYPVKFIKALEQIQRRLVLLGNAAQTLHPNAAQGFNLGLRDVAGLAECVLNGTDRGMEPGDADILRDYHDLRKKDQDKIIRFTNTIASCFYNRLPILSSARNLGLLLLDIMPGVKLPLADVAMGLSGIQPKIVREG